MLNEKNKRKTNRGIKVENTFETKNKEKCANLHCSFSYDTMKH